MRDEAHALKGSAANLRLRRLARAAEDLEGAAKAVLLVAADSSTAEGALARAAALMDRVSAPDAGELPRLLGEFRHFVAFLELDVRGLVRGWGGQCCGHAEGAGAWPRGRCCSLHLPTRVLRPSPDIYAAGQV